MRKILAGSLGLLLGTWISSAHAQETPSVTLGRPIAISSLPPQPLPISNGTDPQLLPAGFTEPLIGLPRPLVRARGSESPQPLPAGPAADDAPLPESPLQQDKPKARAEPTEPGRLMPVPESIGAPKQPGVVEHSVSAPVSSCDEGGICGEDCSEPVCWGLFRRWANVRQDPYCIWFRGEYLLWWMKESPIPPLVTTSPLGTTRDLAGVLGAPGTAVLFQGDGNPERSGGRFTLGFWFDNEHIIGLESTTFFLGERSMTFRAGSAGSPILARPFFNVLTGAEASELVAFPGVLAGNVAISSANQLWGTELNLRTNWWRGCFWDVDWLFGVRFLQLEDNLSIAEGLTVPAGAGPSAGSAIVVQDRFGTHNFFVGGQTGFDVGFHCGRWSLDLLGKVALGNTHQELNVNGFTQFAVPGLPMSVQPGGLYALPSNIGHYSRDRFSVVPEAGFNIGFQLTRCLRAVVGYSFLYNSAVLRAGNQIDRSVNVTQLPSQVGPGTLAGPARPAPVFRSSDFWAQGVNIGLELRY
ncbi:MAG TPA: BBP7 family outer membrane beta-barrel protein [Gemmataceae bacterium]|nr:BBP7 family outer membrane beta-barrel protein [Gemmataceae bacterium]